jgi:Lipid A core - O-antigen ligase and related enzymes
VQLAIVALVLIVILLSLKRSAWLMGLVSVVGYLSIYGKKIEGFSLKRAVSALVFFSFVGVCAFNYSKPLQKQIHNSFVSPLSEIKEIDEASSHRLSLWQTGLRMMPENWINGIGPRSYRDAYPEYASSEDFWMRKSEGGQTHPHWLLLEVGVEAGLVGLLGLTLFYILFYRILNSPKLDSTGCAFLLCAGVSWFPLNMHMAFYGSYWATFVWLLLGFGMAGYQMREKKG